MEDFKDEVRDDVVVAGEEYLVALVGKLILPWWST